MKKLLIPVLLCCFTLTLSAQVKWGPRLGVTTSDLTTRDFDIRSGGFDDLKLGVKEAGYGVQVGAFAQFRLMKLFYLQPEVLFNSNRVDFRVTDFSEGNGVTQVIKERYQYLDIPVIFGLKLGPLRAGVGPVGKVLLSSTSGLADIDGIKEDFSGMNLGYQAALGINLGRLIFDVKFDRSLNDFGDFLSVDGESFDFGDVEKRMVFSLGYSF